MPHSEARGSQQSVANLPPTSIPTPIGSIVFPARTIGGFATRSRHTVTNGKKIEGCPAGDSCRLRAVREDSNKEESTPMHVHS
eukprot:2472781-Rhodomonas_salina.2